MARLLSDAISVTLPRMIFWLLHVRIVCSPRLDVSWLQVAAAFHADTIVLGHSAHDFIQHYCGQHGENGATPDVSAAAADFPRRTGQFFFSWS